MSLKIFLILLLTLSFFIALWFVFGFFMFLIVLKRNGLVGKIIRKKFETNLREYKIDYSWWKNKKLEILNIKTKKAIQKGFLIKNNSNKIAIIVHGIYGTHKDVAPQAKIFYNNGYNVFSPDLRSHGKSGEKFISLGKFESYDLVRWVKKLVNKFGKNCQIVLFGISMGAASVLLSTNYELKENVKCVIADSSFCNAYDELKYLIKRRAHVSQFLIFPNLNFFSKIFAKTNLKEVSPIQSVKSANLPILFIHGLNDDFVPATMSKQMFEVSNKTICEKFFVKNAKHIRSFATSPFLYKKKVLSFVNKWIK